MSVYRLTYILVEFVITGGLAGLHLKIDSVHNSAATNALAFVSKFVFLGVESAMRTFAFALALSL
jgi:hypothetical protein